MITSEKNSLFHRTITYDFHLYHKLIMHSLKMDTLHFVCFVWNSRGLTLPDSGGDIKMRAFLDSLKHACKVPNTEQPFACLDLMFLGTLLDQLLGFKQGSMLYSTNHIGGMDGHWPLSLAFDIYQNGLWFTEKYIVI